MPESKSPKSEGLIYKGRPLRRVDNFIYYGSMDLALASKVSVQLQLTDANLKSRDRVVKKSEKDSLYAAMDVASIWLERALKEK